MVRAVAGGRDHHSKVAAASTTASPMDLASPRRRPSSLPLHGADRHGADPRRRPSPSLLAAAVAGASTTTTVTGARSTTVGARSMAAAPAPAGIHGGAARGAWDGARRVEVGTALPSLSLFLHLPLPLPLQMTTMRSGHHGPDPAPTARIRWWVHPRRQIRGVWAARLRWWADPVRRSSLAAVVGGSSKVGTGASVGWAGNVRARWRA